MQSRSRSHATSLCTVLLAACAWGEDAAATSVEDIFAEPRIEGTRADDVVISPDQKYLAYTWNADGRRSPMNLYVATTGDGKTRQLTHFEDEPHDEEKRQEWSELRQLFAEVTTDSLDELPEYFEDDSKKHRVSNVVWSPDSKSLVFVVRGDLFLVRVNDGRIRRITHTHDTEGSPAWSPDGRYISFVRGGSIWLAELSSERRIQVTKPLTGEQSLSSYRWSPDSRHIAYLASDHTGRGKLTVPNFLPDRVSSSTVREGYPNMSVHLVSLAPLWPADGEHDGDDPHGVYSDLEFEVFDADLGSGKHPWVSTVVWRPQSDFFVVQDITPDMKTRKLHYVNTNGDTRLVLMEADPAWYDDHDWTVTEHVVLEFSPDGSQLLLDTERNGWHHLEKLAVEFPAEPTVPPDTEELIEGLDPHTAGGSRLWSANELTVLTQGNWVVNWAAWIDDENIVLLSSRKSSSERHLERLDSTSGELQSLGTAPGMNTHPQVGDEREWVLYRHSRLAKPHDWYTLRLKPKAAPVRVTQTVPQRFYDVPWNVPEIVSFPAKDGVSLQGLLYRPKDFDASRRYPVVVFVHGAGIMQNVKDGWTVYSPNFKFHTVLTERGFLVFEVDYRGSLGYGRDFRAGVYDYIGGKDLQDELAGLDYLRGLGFADMQRVGIYGGSYGGFMALMALFKAPEHYAAGAALRFVSDWENYYRGNPWYCIQRLGKPDDNADGYYRSSPIHFAENLEDPLLLLHGMRDSNVHFQDAAQLTERLIRLGKDFELMMYPVENHGFSEPESWIDEYERIEEFFVRVLQP